MYKLRHNYDFKQTTYNYKSYNINNFREIPQLKNVSEENLFAMEVVAQVLPFKSNSYCINELINWDNIPDDPMFILTFPQKDMLIPEHFDKIASLMQNGAGKEKIKKAANEIRMELNPQPAEQLNLNIPMLDGKKLWGTQHKYRETVLFFPKQGQTCHAYCTFCFRWAQFIGIEKLKFSSKEIELLISYLQKHHEVTNLLFTGGDPLFMSTKILSRYIEPLLENELPYLHTIRIGSKALGHWPNRFLTDTDADDLMRLFEKVIKKGKNLALMAHFNHPKEMQTKTVQNAIKRLRSVGVQIRTQSPLLKHINDSSECWKELWREQVKAGCIPYYMFIARDTGAQHYFSVNLERAWQIYRNAYKNVSGISRTVRGPCMSTSPGKIQILGVNKIKNEKVFLLRFLQARNPDWVGRPFYAKYNPTASWLNDLIPAFGEKKYFWTEEYEKFIHQKKEFLLYSDED